MHHLLCTEFSDKRKWENKVLVFWFEKSYQPIFYPKHIENNLNILINLSMTLKNPKNSLKNLNQHEFKNILIVRSVFSRKEKEKNI
jgi:hypothetical protein